MRTYELLTEKISRGRPIVCVDVQPTYMAFAPKHYSSKVAKFLAGSRGPVLMYVNADETGMTEDNVEHEIFPFWEELFKENGDDFYEDGFPKMEFFDKGYGYLRAWMDHNVDKRVIIKVIREMYKQKVHSSEDLFGGDEDKLMDFIYRICGGEGNLYKYCPLPSVLTSDPLHVGWVALNQLKKYNNCYLIGGGRHECLAEIALLMNAFNIKYTMINSLIYG